MSPPPADAAARELADAVAALRELGYRYNDADELRSVDGDAPFKFVNQARGASARAALAPSTVACVCRRARTRASSPPHLAPRCSHICRRTTRRWQTRWPSMCRRSCRRGTACAAALSTASTSSSATASPPPTAYWCALRVPACVAERRVATRRQRCCIAQAALRNASGVCPLTTARAQRLAGAAVRLWPRRCRPVGAPAVHQRVAAHGQRHALRRCVSASVAGELP